MLGWISADLSYLKWPRCVHVMLGWFSADPFYILNGQNVYISCLGGLVYFADPSYILNGLPSMTCRHLGHLRYKMGLH
jgi:hypothetical protein